MAALSLLTVVCGAAHLPVRELQQRFLNPSIPIEESGVWKFSMDSSHGEGFIIFYDGDCCRNCKSDGGVETSLLSDTHY